MPEWHSGILMFFLVNRIDRLSYVRGFVFLESLGVDTSSTIIQNLLILACRTLYPAFIVKHRVTITSL
ncbi:hypothetical protein GKR41_00778 [Candidatus Vallotia lariciata]|nr:hypothetical protein GKR41_00778 [Candidatus Vallotia lariciata]